MEKPFDNSDKPSPKIRFIVRENQSRKKGEHLIGYAMRMQTKGGGFLVARIYSEYRPENGIRVYIARDFNGQRILPITTDLTQLKKDLRANARQLDEDYHSFFNQKETRIEQKERTEQIEKSMTESRQKELSEIRERNGREQDQEIER